MNKWFCYIINTVIALNIWGCAGVSFKDWHFPYTMEVQQGNYITEDQIHQLHKGMTKEQVSFIIGHPLTQFMFDQNRWDFVYQDYKNDTLQKQYRVTLFFDKNDIVTDIIESGAFFDK